MAAVAAGSAPGVSALAQLWLFAFQQQTKHAAAPLRASQRLLRRTTKTVLIATRQQRKSRGRTHGRIDQRMGETQALVRHAVDVRRHIMRRTRTAVAAKVSRAQIVGEDEDEIGTGVYGEKVTPKRRSINRSCFQNARISGKQNARRSSKIA